MGRTSEAKKSRSCNLEHGRQTNRNNLHGLRSGKVPENPVPEESSSRSVDDQQEEKEFDRKAHLKGALEARILKDNEKKRVEQNRQNAVYVAKAKQKDDDYVASTSHIQTKSPTPPTPEALLGMKKSANLSNKGLLSVKHFLQLNEGITIGSQRTIEKAKKTLDQFIKYERVLNQGVRLEAVLKAVEERRRRLDLLDERGKRLIFSLDKGHGRVISTISFLICEKPCSSRNCLPLQAWEGSDSYDTLKEKQIWKDFETLVQAGYMVFLGGDLSFLNTNFGLSCGMTFGCLWCNKRFDKKPSADKDSIDFQQYADRSDLSVEAIISKVKGLKEKKENLLDVSRTLVIPPILHAKIKIGNQLFDQLVKLEGSSQTFQDVCRKWKLDVNRKSDGIIYARFNGNDIKNLCRSLVTSDLAAVSSSCSYQKIISALRQFNKWSQMVSTTKSALSDKEINDLACKGKHSKARNCCQTAILCDELEKVGGFGQSILVHALLLHLGPFVHEHKFIGNASEEGIEAVHSKLESEFARNKVGPQEDRLMNSLKWLGYVVLLNDDGKMTS